MLAEGTRSKVQIFGTNDDHMTALTNDIDAAQVKPSLFILYKPFKIPINDPILILLNNPVLTPIKPPFFWLP
jgi:hypothetical protein